MLYDRTDFFTDLISSLNNSEEQNQAQRGNTEAKQSALRNRPTYIWVKEQEIDEGVTRGSLNF